MNIRHVHSRKLLDLCCGEGLVSWGYWSSGMFSEIVGVDIDPEMSTRYSFDFIQGDMLALDYEFLSQFDFIHASPPCQGYSYGTPKEIKARHMKLIAATHHMLFASGKPFVIENVPGAKRDLRPNAEMNGLYFELPINRPRYFRVSGLTAPLRLIKPGRGMRVHGGDYVERVKLIEAFGLEQIISRHALKLMTRDGIKQGIPPVFTKTLAELLFDSKVKVG